MSRSYKKQPVHKDHVKGAKNHANRKVRYTRDFDVDGRAYRKLFSSYDVSDWHFRETLASWMHWWTDVYPMRHGRHMDERELEDERQHWFRYYHRK